MAHKHSRLIFRSMLRAVKHTLPKTLCLPNRRTHIYSDPRGEKCSHVNCVCVSLPSQTHCQTVRLKRSDSLGRRKPSCIIETSQRLNCITNVSLHSKAPSLCRGYLNWCFTPENSPNLMLVSIWQAQIWLSLCAQTFTIRTIVWYSFCSGIVLL